jgi:RNase adapter protein RapZ
MRLLLVTGLSGAGKSTVLKTLQDMGHETIDNMPLSMVPMLLSTPEQSERMVVIGADARTYDFSVTDFIKLVHQTAAQSKHQVTVLYLECTNEVLLQRYSETRRKHPLAADMPVLSGIQRERYIIEPLLDHADIVIDTTDMNMRELQEAIKERFSPRPSELSIFLKSFAFKKGVPRDADLVIDVRFLQNPFYVEHLKDKTGLDKEVGDYIAADPDFESFFAGLTGWLLPLLPRYRQEGKSYLTIAIGCTGGRHRSVYTVERLYQALKEKQIESARQHRELTVKM